MKAQHTPGPWHVGKKQPDAVFDNAGNGIADTQIFLFTKDDALQAQANARLIAAAPSLLLALEQIVRHIDFERGADGEVNHEALLATTRSAIAAAKGE